MSRRLAFGLLPLLAALLPVRIEASRTSAWESNPPATIAAGTTAATSALASLTPAARASTSLPPDVLNAPPRFDLGDVTLAPADDDRAAAFDLGAAELLAGEPPRGPPQSYPETRVRVFELSGPYRVGPSPSLSLWSRQACGFPCLGIASDGPQDPWGLAGCPTGSTLVDEGPPRLPWCAGPDGKELGPALSDLDLFNKPYQTPDCVENGVGCANQFSAIERDIIAQYNAQRETERAVVGLVDTVISGLSMRLRGGGSGQPSRQALAKKNPNASTPSPRPIRKYEVTTFEDFRRRSTIGDELEGHEPLQHAVLKRENKATARLSTEASRKNPVIALPRSQHVEVNKAQIARGTDQMPAPEGIAENTRLMREAGVPPSKAKKAMEKALEHARRLGLGPEEREEP